MKFPGDFYERMVLCVIAHCAQFGSHQSAFIYIYIYFSPLFTYRCRCQHKGLTLK